MENKTELLIPEATYHIYNRANGDEKLFRSQENYRYFLQKYDQYISPIAHTFCYCLMPNHFHFLIRIKKEDELAIAAPTGFGTLSELKGLEGETEISTLLSLRFSHLFNGYTQALNKQCNRKGSLFMRPYKRKRVDDLNYLHKLVHYIHYNPIEAKLCRKLQEWPHSSYTTILNCEESFLNTKEVLDWFNDRENFAYFHSNAPGLNMF
jgi:putative transposase